MENEIVQFTPVSALSEITKGEIDIQIATAHKFPRSLEEFNERAIEMVSQDIETAESCIYLRPVGKDKFGKQIIVEGESVRLAEIVAACYGNIRVVATIIEQTDQHVIARGMAHDLQSNNAQSAEAIESNIDSNGKQYSNYKKLLNAKVALAKARRDAIFMVVPKALCKKITTTAKEVIAKNQKPLKERISAALNWIDRIKVDRKKVYKLLNVKGEADIGLEELEILTGIKTAIKEDPGCVNEIFDPKQGEDNPVDLTIDSDLTDLDIAISDLQNAKTLESIAEIEQQFPGLAEDAEFVKAVDAFKSKLAKEKKPVKEPEQKPTENPVQKQGKLL
uniref:Uncharacterized protein n=1 Tax=viral metagenome TaxID=1070528 RepID=A0A6M3KLT4_9ZZZZ